MWFLRAAAVYAELFGLGMSITSNGVLKKVSLWWLMLDRTSKPDSFLVGAFFTIEIPL